MQPSRTGSNPSATPLPSPGDQIDSFVLEESIGVGGMGAVFRALDLRLDRHVALKILPPEQAHDKEVVQRFCQEGRAAARLDHENIARVFTIGNDASYYYIAFEFIDGTTIRQRVERSGPLSISEAINYTLQIASALVHACERGVVHRDIKPSNIIVTTQGRAKLVDMGLARRFERGGDDGLTQSGMTLGTFDYISPEQARDPRDVDVRSDLYSLGCTLFHMLGGRPPFPDGTVLQKLIQHQEDAPPDIRALNPQVPVELANVLAKLMAKDRDRRYQSPEQLVRDLLIIAGALGLRSVSPEGLVWMAATRPPAWERHLVWGIPTLGFATVVLGLIWWGQEPPTASPTSYIPPPVVKSEPAKPAPDVKATAVPVVVPADRPTPAPVEAVAVRDIAVDSGDDLIAKLAAAPPRSIVVLNDDGPYLIGVESLERGLPARLTQRDVTIKAAAGVHPVLRLAREGAAKGGPAPALFDFDGGHVTIEGIQFELDASAREGSAAVRADGTELTIRRCVFRRTGARLATGTARSAAIATRGRPATNGGQRPASVVVDSAHFDPSQIALLARGPADVTLRDCTIAASGTAFWFENDAARGGTPVDLRLEHDSIVAGNEPVFRFEGTEPRVWVDDSIIAPGHDAVATLVSADDPARLTWTGRGNLIGRIGTFLVSSDSRSRFEPVRDAVRWSESLAGVRETGSSFTSDAVWDDDDPIQALVDEPSNPSRSFWLSEARAGHANGGARQGPFGTIGRAPRLVAAATEERPRPPEPRTETPAPATTPAGPVPEADFPPPMPKPGPMPMPMPAPASTDAADPSNMPPMRREETPAPSESPEPPRTETRPNNGPSTASAGNTATPSTPRPPGTDAGLVRTADELLDAFRKPGQRGSILRIAPDADIELPPLAVDGDDHRILRAEQGTKRPRLRLRSVAASKRGTGWEAGLELPSGALQLEGFDVVLPRTVSIREGRWAVFGLGAGAELTLINCTVTVEGDLGDSAAFVVRPVTDANANTPPGRKPARLRVTDCLLRAGGDLVDVGAGTSLDLDMNNAVVSTGGSMVRAHGVPRGAAESTARLDIELRLVSTRTAGGLILLDSAPGEPELPVANVSARDAIFTTTLDGDPLLRVDGQDAPASLSDRIHWEGQHVAYHQITAYRRDQSAQIGSVPNVYDQPSWAIAVGAREADPIHGDLKFAHDWDPERPAWALNRDDMKLLPDSPARSSGADLQRIPAAPAGL